MQNKVNELIKQFNSECNTETRYIDLISEVGELGKEILKGSNYNNQEYKKTPNTELELGDCLFSLLALCSNLNLDANNCLDKAIEKYNNRFKEKNCISSD